MPERERLLLLLLPGLDGTGKLFARFIASLPEHLEAEIVRLPNEPSLGFAELTTRVRERLPTDRPFALLGESFSGPLALQLAAARPPGLLAVVLAASFHRRPVPAWMAALEPLAGALISRPPPAWVARRFLVGSDAPAELVDGVRSAIREAAPGVLARRVREALHVDATDALLACPVPLLYLEASQDRLLRRSTLRELRTLRPDLEARTVAAPHLLLQREPRRCAEIVSEFLARVTPPA